MQTPEVDYQNVEILIGSYENCRGEDAGKLMFRYEGERLDDSQSEIEGELAEKFYNWNKKTSEVEVSAELQKLPYLGERLSKYLGENIGFSIKRKYSDPQALRRENKIFFAYKDVETASELAERFYKELLEEN